MTAHCRKEHEIMLQPDYRDRGILPLTEILHKDVVEKLLSRSEGFGLHIYDGMTADSRVQAILAGVTAESKPILPKSGTELNVSAEEGYLAD